MGDNHISAPRMQETDELKPYSGVILALNIHVHDGFYKHLDYQPIGRGINYIGRAKGEQEGIQLVQETQPDIAIIDPSISHHPVDLVSIIKKSSPKTKQFLVGETLPTIYARACCEAGANAYLDTGSSREWITNALYHVLESDLHMSTFNGKYFSPLQTRIFEELGEMELARTTKGDIQFTTLSQIAKFLQGIQPNLEYSHALNQARYNLQQMAKKLAMYDKDNDRFYFADVRRIAWNRLIHTGNGLRHSA